MTPTMFVSVNVPQRAKRIKMIPPITVVMLMLVSTTQGQEKAPNASSGLWNGRAWQEWTQGMKLGYVLGLHDGMFIFARRITSKLPATEKRVVNDTEEFGAMTFANGEYIKEMDAFYAETENVKMPIVIAFDYCTDKLSGKYTKAELEQELIRARTIFSDAERTSSR